MLALHILQQEKSESKLATIQSMVNSFFAIRSTFMNTAIQQATSNVLQTIELIRLFQMTILLSKHMFCKRFTASLVDRMMKTPEPWIKWQLEKQSKQFETIYHLLYAKAFAQEYAPVKWTSSDEQADAQIDSYCSDKLQQFLDDFLNLMKQLLSSVIQSCQNSADLIHLEDVCKKYFGDEFHDVLYVYRNELICF